MMRSALSFIVLVSIALFVGVVRAEDRTAPPVPPVEGELTGEGVDCLAFIAGDWRGELFGGVVDETWLPPNQGTMIGMMRLMWAEGRPNIYEFFAVEELDDGRVVMTFRHFSPQSQLWEREKEKPNSFILVEAGARRAAFDAPDRSQSPARFVFLLSEDERTLTIKVQGFDDDGEVTEGFDAVYTRADD